MSGPVRRVPTAREIGGGRHTGAEAPAYCRSVPPGRETPCPPAGGVPAGTGKSRPPKRRVPRTPIDVCRLGRGTP